MTEQFAPEHPLWAEYVAHLERVNMAQWIMDENGQPLPNVYFSGIRDGDNVVGHISVRVQDIVSPATEWSNGKEVPILGADGKNLRETFVQTFGVEETHRRRGYGRALQLAALKLTKELGCCQIRSWSSADKKANYSLKLNLGFAVHPATSISGLTGELISGVYFVKTV